MDLEANNTSATPAESSLVQRVYADQVALLYSHAPLACLITFVISSLLVAVHWSTVATLTLLVWLLLMATITLARLALAVGFRRRQPSLLQAPRWGRWYIVATAITGLCWGISAFILFSQQSFEQRTVSVLILAGMAAGGVPILAAIKPAAFSFLVAIMLPITLAFAVQDGESAWFMALASLIFLGSMIAAGTITHRSVLQALHLRRQNQILLQNTVAEKNAISALNTKLQAAIATRDNAESALREANKSLEARVFARTEELERLANHDPLTQLPNRLLLQDRLEHALANAERKDGRLALLFLDLDRFKTINDSLGHDAGDALLQIIAERLQEAVRKTDTVARLGGDEFVIVLEGLRSDTQTETVARKVLQTVAMPIRIKEQTFNIGVSIGISLYPQDGIDSNTLLKNADLALQQVKEQGRNDLRFFNATIGSDSGQRLGLESDLQRAFENRELLLHYQPQVELATATVIGVEALLRWPHPQRGLVPTVTLITLAEATGLINPIGQWVLQTACRQVKTWNDQGLGPLSASVNVSARQFMQVDFVDQVKQALAETQLKPSLLTLEITESMLMHDLEHAVATLRALKNWGVEIAVDDFGTGYSSLGYLAQFPLDWLKIDASFVRELETKPDRAAIISAVLSLAHSLGLRVVVEGVEEPPQLAFIRARHANVAQGFLFSRALPADEASAWLRQPRLDALTQTSTAATTVLIVEDDQTQRELYSIWLEREGFVTITASDAEQALTSLARQSVILMLVDYALPGMDGVEFLRRVRSIYPDTLRLLMSARTDKMALARAINEGGVLQYLDKPITEDQLRQTVRAAVVHQGDQASPKSLLN